MHVLLICGRLPGAAAPRSPQHIACSEGHLSVVEFLLERQADISARCLHLKTMFALETLRWNILALFWRLVLPSG